MKLNPRFWWMALAFSFVSAFCSAQDLTDASTGVKFPGSVSFEEQGKNYTLSATGVATRKKFFVKVYSVASYVEDPARLSGGDASSSILNAKGAKQLTLSFVRDVPEKKLVEGYRESFGKVGYNNQEILNKFFRFFENTKNKDQHIFRWLPDGTVVILVNNEERGRLQNPEFARALWSVWFGNAGVVDKKQLTNNLK